MIVVVDTTVIIDVLRGHGAAMALLEAESERGRPHGSEVTRLEVLAGMRANEEVVTRGLLGVFIWHPLDQEVAEHAGDLGRRWLPGNRGTDAADLAIAATADLLDARLLTRNVKHFPMFADLTPPY